MSRRKVLYMAATERGRFATQYNYAVVTTGAYTTERLAMRHARAMLEVYRAGMALARSFRRSQPLPGGNVPDGFARLTRAVAKLEAVEREVRRG